MAALLEIDDAGHVAVVQPGLTLAELDVETAKHGLVYPVFPGTNAASLGGNVATNAGGMRAVKYGVTRNQVLGIEAVTGTGEVIRSGGRFVKNTSGYDLTQLIIGSEGTLGVVTEATLRLHPRLAHSASILAPFASIDEVADVIPKVVASGVQPMILEYIDRSTMKGLLRLNDLTLGIPTAVGAKTEAYLVVVLEGRTEDRLEHDVAEVATQLGDAGAFDVYVLPAGQGAELLAARESAFWMVKAAGADDVIDMVVPRNRIPGTSPRPGHRRSSRRTGLRVRARRRRQHPLLGVRTRRGQTLAAAARHLRDGHGHGRRHLGRARHRPHQEALLRGARGSREDRAPTSHQGRLRPRGHPQPGLHLRLIFDAERSGRSASYEGMTVSQSVTRSLIWVAEGRSASMLASMSIVDHVASAATACARWSGAPGKGQASTRQWVAAM
jgi:FAD/FMN-containing dehydrogenase